MAGAGATSIMGMETEYSLLGLDAAGRPVQRGAVAALLIKAAARRCPHLPGHREGDLFLANGARMYTDAGVFPEYATPECTRPEETVAAVRAGNRILEQAAADVVARGRITEIVLCRNNTDAWDPGATWGNHENVLYRTSREVMARNIIPHLVTRPVYSGAGGLDAAFNGIRFTVSPRTRFLVRPTFHNSTASERGIFHCKDEGLAGAGLHRLHIVCGESLCSETADYLRIGATALIVALIDAGHEVGIEVAFHDPVAGMHAVALDTRCRKRLLVGRRRLTAIEVQRHYLARVREQLGARFMPSWAEPVCDLWARTLDALESDPLSMATTLDWPLKLTLFRQRAARRGLTWEQIQDINALLPASVHKRVAPVAPGAGDDPQGAGAPLALGLWPRGSPEAARMADVLCDHGLPRDALEGFLDLRQELFEIDTRYSQLGDKGIFGSLDRAGVLEHRILSPEAAQRAVTHPPMHSRARQRARQIRRMAGNPRGKICDWTGIIDVQAERRLDMYDPFGRRRARWRECPGPRRLPF